MPTTKTEALNLRIRPDQKTALQQIVKKRGLSNIAKLVMPEIERLLTTENTDDIPGRAVPEGGEGIEAKDLKGVLQFIPMPGDELYVRQYAAARGLTPSTTLKLLLRAWINQKPHLPKHELTQLNTTANHLGAIGRNLNQLAKHANSGDYPLQEELAVLLATTLELAQQARQEVRAVVQANLESWGNDYNA